MKVIQKISENKGIEWDKNHAEIAGYQHHDGLWFGNEYHITYKSLAIEIYEKIIKPNNMKVVLELGSGAGSLSYFLRELSNNELIVVTLDGNKDVVNSPYIKKEHNFILKTNEKLSFSRRK